MFDFNKYGVTAGSKVVDINGVVVYEVIDAFTPEWLTPDDSFLNDSMYIKAVDLNGIDIFQPIQWLNQCISINKGMKVVNA